MDLPHRLFRPPVMEAMARGGPLVTSTTAGRLRPEAFSWERAADGTPDRWRNALAARAR